MWGDVAQVFSDGVHRVALSVAGFLPGFLTMLLVLAFSVGIAFVVRWAIRRSLAGIDFDRRVHRWGLTPTGEWMPKDSPTSIVAHSVFWFVLLVGFLAGLKSLNTSVTDQLASGALSYLPNLLAAALEQLRIGGAVLTVSFAVVFGGIVLALALAVGLGSRDAVTKGFTHHFGEEKRGAEEADEIHHM